MLLKMFVPVALLLSAVKYCTVVGAVHYCRTPVIYFDIWYGDSYLTEYPSSFANKNEKKYLSWQESKIFKSGIEGTINL
jgi:hypothetical protein